MTPTPIIIFSDHPAAHSGLARITRDLATRIHSHLGDSLKVATLGHGSPGSSHFPFPQYHWNPNDFFVPFELPHIQKDFCADSPSILLTIGDVQRFLPLADPQFCQDRRFGDWWRQQRGLGKFKLWGYFPIDSHGLGGKLPPQLGHTLSHYDRVLVPSNWAAKIVRRTLPSIEVAVIPHGIDTEIFHPIPKEEARDQYPALFSQFAQWPQTPIDIPDDALWVGIVATNQWRKDWGLGLEVVAELAKTRPTFLWAHTDRLKQDGGWSILELVGDLGLTQSTMITTGTIPDPLMAVGYSACDLTLGIGRGEGFSYTNFESIFSGTPCFAYNYGAHTDWMAPDHLISATTHRIEGPLSLIRPTGQAEYWAYHIGEGLKIQMRYPEELKWDSVWPKFQSWFQNGLK